MFARLSEAMGAALVGNNFQPIPMDIPFPKKKNSVVTARYLQSIKTLLTLELSQYSKSNSTFSSSEPVAARSDCRRLGNSPVDEVWNTLTAVLNFGVLKRIQTPHSLLNFILGFRSR